MKPVIKIVSFILLAGVLLYISCKKEYSCENCIGGNQPPIANAGPDQVVTLPTDSVSLDGSASSDPDGSISAYLWKKISGPASFTINNAPAAKTVVKKLAAGSYQFELKVTDNGGLSAKDTMRVTVDSVITTNHPPIANAGADQIITLPVSTVNLDGSASSDPDNNITGYAWTKIGGSSSFNITNASAVQTQVSNLVQGTYLFELKVTDAGGLFSKDTMQVTVNAAVSNNLPPVARAGNDTTIQSNQTSCTPIPITITLNGSNSYDPDGTIVSYFWYGINGITNPNAAVTTVSGLVPGTASFTLKVTDNNGAFSYDTIKITILPANRPLVPAQLIPIATLPFARHGLAVAIAGNKILFAGGQMDGGAPSSRVDIYDITTGMWSVSQLSQARFNAGVAVLGNKIFFAGGIVPRLSNGPPVDPIGAGIWYTSDVASFRSTVIDIYDVSTNTWSIEHLSTQRAPVGVTVNSKVIFAGSDVSYQSPVESSKIDIYDAGTSTWTTAVMSEPRDLNQPAVGNAKVYFPGGSRDMMGVSGGLSSKRIDIYDASTGSWSIDDLSQDRFWMGNIVANNKLYCGGGFVYDPGGNDWSTTNAVEIKDLVTNTTSFDCLSEAKALLTAVRKDNKIVFFGGYSPYIGAPSSLRFDIYDLTTNSWSIGVLPQYTGNQIISYNNILYVTDGNQVWKLDF